MFDLVAQRTPNVSNWGSGWATPSTLAGAWAYLALGGGWFICSGRIAVPAGMTTPAFQIAMIQSFDPVVVNNTWTGDGIGAIQVAQLSAAIDGASNVLVAPSDLTNAAWTKGFVTIT
jgi:hypothetical protein